MSATSRATRIHIVDAFTARPFAGNPAGVCLLPAGDWPEEAWMQQVAAEVNHSETAFARPRPEAAGGESAVDWELRWFTPVMETNLCGHATLATTHVLRMERGIAGTVRFHSRFSGVLVAHAEPEGDITLDFPAAPGTERPVPDGLAAALGAEPQATYGTGALGDLLAVLEDEDAVRAARPDPDALAAVVREAGLRGVMITAPASTDRLGYDFVSRFFSPNEGIAEDPVTGSAHTALAPYWSARLGRDGLTGLQASPRSGLVRTAVRGDRVHLTGGAVTVLDGTLHV
ncbi:PhzF family phenazine biosynthesis protein [Streptomyces armeniacus]|uniref:PhzF family phenazine biosynthesis protein n=1 Tax=Streptomyces armeniacus TaxID=83291 RepID=A0A345XUU9_9ACTN|nr:PhzF family phenazine biosynthesis protein [Streptomyces armeniacus]AXK35415.1 PhzF family phenazine biosynthesis protein [Streptomyces armeniacus]